MADAAGDPIAAALTPGETILWRGQPAASGTQPGLTPSMRLLGATGALAAGLGSALTLYALVAALRHNEYFEAPLLLMLALVTLSMFAACVRFATRDFGADFDSHGQTHFAITTARVIVARDGTPGKIQALANDGTLEFDHDRSADGAGSITFCAGDDGAALTFHDLADASRPLQVLRDLRDGIT